MHRVGTHPSSVYPPRFATPHAPSYRDARTTKSRSSGTVSRSCEAKHYGTSRWISLLLSGGDGERQRTVGREGWRSTEAPRRAFARCTSRARDCGRSPLRTADTRVPAWHACVRRGSTRLGERRTYLHNCYFARHSREFLSDCLARFDETRLHFASGSQARSCRPIVAVRSRLSPRRYNCNSHPPFPPATS